MPIYHDCQRCTACCRWPGQVRVSLAEITRIATFLEQDETDFVQQYTRLQHDRRGLALQEQPDGACVFLKDQLCVIQPVKPQQCRDFPNLWQYPGAEQFCRAIPREVSAEDYVNLVATATRRSVTEVREILKHSSPRQS